MPYLGWPWSSRRHNLGIDERRAERHHALYRAEGFRLVRTAGDADIMMRPDPDDETPTVEAVPVTPLEQPARRALIRAHAEVNQAAEAMQTNKDMEHVIDAAPNC